MPLHEDEAELNVDRDGGEDGERVAVEAAAEEDDGLAQEVDQAQQQQDEKRDEERNKSERDNRHFTNKARQKILQNENV